MISFAHKFGQNGLGRKAGLSGYYSRERRMIMLIQLGFTIQIGMGKKVFGQARLLGSTPLIFASEDWECDETL